MSWFSANSAPSITDTAISTVYDPVWTSVPGGLNSSVKYSVSNSTTPNTVPTWTVTTPNTAPTWTTNPGGWGVGGSGAGGYHIDRTLKGGQLHLEGDDADININGKSLMATLRSLEQRLNILRPNTELEAEWDQLRELGEQYRRLEKEFEEKSKMWNRLKTK